jgi:hypothetical protein
MQIPLKVVRLKYLVSLGLFAARVYQPARLLAVSAGR